MQRMPVADDVRRAAAALRGKVWRTPTLRSEALDALAGAEVFLKAECLQRIGAFKARGAMFAIGNLPAERRARGVCTYSSGNHAQAVALAAAAFGVPAYVTMPEDASPVKVASVRSLGGQVTFAGLTSDDRQIAAERIAAETGAAIVPPFDDPDIIAGQGTATLELLEDAQHQAEAPLDAIYVPVGGGGLVAGAVLATEGTDTEIISVEPTTCDALARSLEAGSRVAVPPGPTIADGLKPVRVGELPFAVAKGRVRRWLRADDEAIGRALTTLLLKAHVLVEPSGAAGLAGALADARGKKRVGVILSGGNVAPEALAELLARFPALG
jgi:threonine dehydratase